MSRCAECNDRDCPGCDPADRPREFVNARVVGERRAHREPDSAPRGFAFPTTPVRRCGWGACNRVLKSYQAGFCSRNCAADRFGGEP